MAWVIAGAFAVILIIMLSRRLKRRPSSVLRPAEAGRPAMTPSAQRSGMSAAEVFRRAQQLQEANAGWPEIWQTLNPNGDSLSQQLLIELRAPYMFNPQLGLNMIKIGCERVMASSPSADRLSALRASLSADDRIVRPR